MVSTYGLGLALVAAASWGAVYVIYEQVLRGIAPLNAMFIASLASVVMIAFLYLVRGESPFSILREQPNLTAYLVIAVAVTLLGNWTILSSIKELGAPTASIIEVCYPLFTMLFLALFFGQGFPPRFVMGSAFVLFGIILVVTSPRVETPARTPTTWNAHPKTEADCVRSRCNDLHQ